MGLLTCDSNSRTGCGRQLVWWVHILVDATASNSPAVFGPSTLAKPWECHMLPAPVPQMSFDSVTDNVTC